MFQQAIIKSVQRLEKAVTKGLINNFALIGGFAVSRWAKPRATGDIDYIIQVRNMPLTEIAQFLNGTYNPGDTRDPLLATLSYEEKVGKLAVPIQLLQFPLTWEELSFEKIDIQKIEGISIPFVHWEALVLLKLYAGGAYDMEDARNILDVVDPSKKEMDELRVKAVSLRVSGRLARIQQ